jgi:hypothetical protein
MLEILKNIATERVGFAQASGAGGNPGTNAGEGSSGGAGGGATGNHMLEHSGGPEDGKNVKSVHQNPEDEQADGGNESNKGENAGTTIGTGI